jgi:hypothetical protein
MTRCLICGDPESAEGRCADCEERIEKETP